MNRDLFIPALGFVTILLFWEFASQLFEAHQFVLPPPSAIVDTLWHRFGRFSLHAQVTLGEMIGGFLLAFAAAFPLAWMMHSWTTARRFFQPLFIAIQCVPMFALAPIMVLWFGWGYSAIVIPTALMIFFPLTMNIFQGFQTTPKKMIEYFQLQNATPWQLFTKLQLPWALPYIFTGVRISAAIAGIGAVAGEWAGAQQGLGVLMLESRRATDLETTFGALIVLAAMSMAIYGLIVLLEKNVRKLQSPLKKAACILLVFLTAGCSSFDDRPKTRLVLDWLPNPNHIPLFVGIEKGFFSAEQIDLEIRKISDPSDLVSYLRSGQADLVLYFMPDVIRANANGYKITPVGMIIKEPLNGIIYRKGEGIVSPNDLNGKDIGYCVDGTTTKVLDQILSQNQITHVEKHNVTFDLVSTLGTKRVDAIYGAFWNIECEHLRSLGVETDYFTLRELGVPNYYELMVVAKSDSAFSQSQFAGKLQKALQESIDFSVDNPEIAFKIYADLNLDKTEKTLSWELQAWMKTIPLLAKDQESDPRVWSEFEAWFDKHGL